jgi:hypothetical protein
MQRLFVIENQTDDVDGDLGRLDNGIFDSTTPTFDCDRAGRLVHQLGF